MSNLGPQQQNASYDGVLQIPGGVTAQLQQVQDGEGRGTGLFLSSAGSNAATADSFVVSVDGISVTGAVPRLISDGFGDYISVKDFGAVGDGVTDDTVAILKAFSYLNNNSAIVFPAGVYVFDDPYSGISRTIANLSNIGIIGYGATIKLGLNTRFLNYMNSITGFVMSGMSFQGSLSDSQRFTGNEQQGLAWFVNSSNIEIKDCTWTDCSESVFIATGNHGAIISENNFVRCHAPVIVGGNSSCVTVSNNYFLGHVYNTPDYGSDDQIAVFSGEANCSNVIISGNVIDKQGPTAVNQAHGILLQVTAHELANIAVFGNTIQNCVNNASTSIPVTSAAIGINGTGGGGTLKNAIASSNSIYNCNVGIEIGGSVLDLIGLNSNTIQKTVYNANYTGSPNFTGVGISTVGGTYTNLSINGNSVKDCDKQGIYVYPISGLTISSNLVTDCGSAAVTCDTPSNVTISGNTIKNSAANGLTLNQVANGSVSGNNIVNNTGHGIQIQGATFQGLFAANNVANNTAGNFIDYTSHQPIEYIGNVGLGTTSISGTGVTGYNLRGTANFSAASSVSVSFFTAEPTSSYYIALGPETNNTYWVSNKLTTGFTINCSTSVTANVDWILIR